MEYTLKVKDTKDVTDAKKDFSMAKLSFTDTNGAAFSDRQQFPICFDAPVLGITHTVTGDSKEVTELTGVTGGAEKTFTVKVKNTGHKPAYNVGVKVTLPAGLTFKSSSSANAFTSTDNKTLTATIDQIDPYNNTEANIKTLTYTATTADPLGGGLVMSVPAEITTYKKSSSTGAPEYKENLPKAIVTLTGDVPTLANEKVGQEDTVLKAGDWVVYKLTVTVPDKIELYKATLANALPAGQSLVDVYESYANTNKTFGAVKALPTGTETLEANTTYTYYVKAKVDEFKTTGQTDSATLTWADLSTSTTTNHSLKADADVSVNHPVLTGTWSPTSQSINVGDTAKTLTYTITNTGTSTAYNFTPQITVPDTLTASSFKVGETMAEPTATTDDNSNIYTFSPATTELASGASQVITFTVAPNKSTYAPGTVVTITGTPAYDSYHSKEKSGGETLTANATNTTLTFPGTTFTKTKTASSYGTAPGALDAIRPYDTLTYHISYTVPKGTALTNLVLTETIPTGFTLVSFGDNNWTGANGTYTRTLGSVTATGADNVYTCDVTVRADNTVTQAKHTFTTAAVSTEKPTSETKTVDVNIVEPSMTAALSTANDKLAFTDKGDTIAVNADLTNSGSSAAEQVNTVISFPAGMSASAAGDGAVIDNTARTVTWTGLSVAAKGRKTLSFTLTKTGDQNDPSVGDVNLTVNYKSTVDAASKAYTPLTGKVTLVSSEAAPTITLQDKTAVYSGSTITIDPAKTPSTGTVTYTYYTDAGCTTKTPTTTGAASEGSAPANVGTYYVKAAVAANGNYKAATSNVATLTITPAVPSVTLANKTEKYTGNAILIGDASTPSTGTVTYTYYTDAGCTTKTPTTTGAASEGGAPANAGTYYVKVTVEANGNYANGSAQAKLVIYEDKAVPKTYGVTGTIKRETNAEGTVSPVKGAFVKLCSSDNTVLGSVTTGADGKYAFTALSNGSYKLLVSSGMQVMTLAAFIKDADAVSDGTFPYVAEKTVVGGKDATVTGSAVNQAEKTEVKAKLNTAEQFAVQNDSKKGFTSDELSKITSGSNGYLLLELTADNITTTAATQEPKADTAIKTLAAGKTIGEVIDLNMYKHVWPDRTQPLDCTTTQLVSVPQIVKVTVSVPENLRGKSGLTVYRYHGDTAEKLTVKKTVPVPLTECVVFAADNSSVDIYINNFSVYALAYTTPAAYSGGTTPTTASCTLTYQNGGSVVSKTNCETGKDYTVLSGDALTVPDGQRFLGWSTTENGPVVFAPGDSIRINASTTLYAVLVDAKLPVLNRSEHFAYIIGSDDGLVRPEQNITREEVATIFMRLLTDESRTALWSTSNSFSDVPASRWSNNAISTMQKTGVLQGMSDGSFRPADYITRAELAAIVSRFDSRTRSTRSKFSDISGHWAERAIDRAAALGWINGYDDGTFRPDAYISRAEAMALINRLLGRNVSDAGLLRNMVKWPDNAAGVWCYCTVQEATNSHKAVRDENGLETWTGLLPVKDWAALEKP